MCKFRKQLGEYVTEWVQWDREVDQFQEWLVRDYMHGIEQAKEKLKRHPPFELYKKVRIDCDGKRVRIETLKLAFDIIYNDAKFPPEA